MKSNGSARALMPASGRSAAASPLSSSSSFSSRMSPTSGRKKRNASEKLPLHGGPATPTTASGLSSSRTVSPNEGFLYAMDGMMATPAAMAMPGHEFLYQLQNLQHQQMHQQGMAVTAYGYPNGGIQAMPAGFPSQYMPPQMIPRAASSNSLMSSTVEDNTARSFGPVHTGSTIQPQALSNVSSTNGLEAASSGDDDSANLLQRIEKKDHMISQLGSFLFQMKQESEGTATAWKEKLQEIVDLKRQLASVSQQLTLTQDKERETSSQLAQATHDLEAAMHALKEGEQTHIEELTIMNEEIKKRQNEAEHTKVGYEQSLKESSQELLETQQKQHEAASRCRSLEESLQKLEEGHRLVLAQYDEERGGMKRDLEALGKHLEIIDREKQELGQHLWNVSQELQQTKQHEEELERKCASAVNDLEQSQTTWSERFHHFQNEKAEQLGLHSMLQTQLQELDAKYRMERSQKEELNALMVQEMQRFHDELETIHLSQKEVMEREVDEKEQWKLQALEHQEKLVRIEKKYTQAASELEELQGRLRQIDEENQHLQQNGTEKASTLQEMNNQLHSIMEELQDAQVRYEQLHVLREQHQSGLRKCLQLLSSATNLGSQEFESDLIDGFPRKILTALEEFAQLSSVVDEMKISVLRAQQDHDSDRERFRQREQDLVQQCQSMQSDLDTTRADAKTLAQEMQQLSRQSGGNEAKLSAQVQQLTKELDDIRSSSGLQVLQLQKSLDSQRARTIQLENEKKDLLQEAEHLNASMESLYQARNEKQIELDQLRAAWKALQLEHSDLKENYEDLDSRTARTIEELNTKLKELQHQGQTYRTQSSSLKKENEQIMEQLSKLQSEYEALSHQCMSEQAKWLDKEREFGSLLEDKTHRMDEMMEMLTQLQSKSEFLEKSRVNEDQSVRQEIERYQQQVLALGQEKKRFELACSNLKGQHDQVVQEIFSLKEEKRHLVQQQNDLEEELGALKTEHTRLRSELDRVSRTKSSLQVELHRVADEAQDVLRQFEVVRRDARTQEKNYHDEVERLRKEVEELRTEGSESSALVEELQTKMTSIQNAANATINDLMTELQNAQETISYEKNRLQKENDTLKAQVKVIGEDIRRKEMDMKELQAGLRQEKDQFSDKESEMTLKFTRLTNTLEQKKQEVDKLNKELEMKGLKVAEYERKFAPLVNAKESLQAKSTELKQALDAKTREAHDIEERFRDEMSKLMKDKRETEALYMTMKEEVESVRSQTNGHQQQWQSDCKVLKQNLERTKSELMKANTDVLTLTQRLESCQSAANETISELSARLQAAEQQKEMSVNGLQREINLERERRREAEVQKMELQRQLRQKGGTPTTSSTSTPSVAPMSATSEHTILPSEDRPTWSGASLFDADMSSSMPPRSTQNPTAAPPPQTLTPKKKNAPPPEIRKFYANEPMSNAELSNLPMALIKAQIGLDLSSEYSASAAKSSPVKNNAGQFRASSSLSLHDFDHHQENNDDIPPLPLEKLPQ